MTKHTLKILWYDTTRFLKYVWPSFNTIHERVNNRSRTRINSSKLIVSFPSDSNKPFPKIKTTRKYFEYTEEVSLSAFYLKKTNY